MAEYEVRTGYYYTKGDTWAHKEDDGTIHFGISDYAQKKLKEIEYLTLPSEDDAIEQGESLGEVESKKSVSEMMSPLTGTVSSINSEAEDDPSLLNRDPYGAWIVSIDCPDYDEQVKALMDAEAYEAYIASRN